MALSVLATPAASADLVPRSSTQFGTLPIGVTTPTRAYTLTVTCDSANMCAPQPHHTDIDISIDNAR